MTAETTVATVTATTIASAAGTAVAFGSPFAILGAPMWGLLAGIVGATCSYLPRYGVDRRKIPVRLLGIASDGLLGSWLAVFVIHLSLFDGSGVRAMPIEILCGGAAFGMQWMRRHVGPLLEQLAGALIAAVASTVTSWRRPTPPPGDVP